MKKYKLIKEYPGSPKLHTESWSDNGTTCFSNPDGSKSMSSEKLVHSNFPEFWQEVVEKDYEILSIRSKGHIYSNPDVLPGEVVPVIIKDNTLSWIRRNGETDHYPQDYKNNNLETTLRNFDIYSVKRLSDGEVFTIDDNVIIPEDDESEEIKFNINRFEIFKDKLLVYQTSSQTHHVPYITSIQKAKEKLFTTEDGVDIFEGNTYFYISKVDLGIIYNEKARITDLSRSGDNKSNLNFSTKEAAQEYIIQNKPCLSLKDIEYTCSFNTSTIKNMIKDKLGFK